MASEGYRSCPKHWRLFFDATHSGAQGRLTLETAPFALVEGEALELRVFTVKSVS